MIFLDLLNDKMREKRGFFFVWTVLPSITVMCGVRTTSGIRTSASFTALTKLLVCPRCYTSSCGGKKTLDSLEMSTTNSKVSGFPTIRFGDQNTVFIIYSVLLSILHYGARHIHVDKVLYL